MGNPTPSTNEIGLKLSIRLHEPGGGFRDLLGTLVEVDAVRKKDGSVKKFDPQTIAIWKVVVSQ